MREIKLSDLLGTVEVCKRAGVDKSTLSRHVALGKIAPVARIGSSKNGAMLFDREDVDAYIAAIKPERVA